ncbi:copper transporter [Nocardioides sp. WL0053]|uniref:Copper transporter n=1 Tax=Nocardioides jiangsuensis TaxID=2866161 RepID=A0ABS7RDU9_9ACTN|nr:copper transporter [Nocardioides jiangsuensis]MBY9073200.1 copper transporter [Nocardioides jiangsuensis]
MISFRYHIVSIVSVFLALAVGVALGGGPLKGEVDNTLVEQVEADRRAKADLQAEIASLRSSNQFTDAFATGVAPRLVGGTLDGRAVTMVVLPGAPEATVTSTTELIGAAGGSVGATVRVGEALVDVGQKQLVDELASQLLEGAPDVAVPEDASGYERLGALLARAVATTEDGGAEVDDASNSIMAGLSTAGLLSPAGEIARRGSLVVFVGGYGAGTTEEREGASTIVSSIARAVDAETDGVVVAAPSAAAEDGGVVDVVRRDVTAAQEVSTVDALGRVAGQVVTVMALAEQAGGGAGHYGAVDAADGAFPGANEE